MAVHVTVSDVMDQVETDLPDSVIQGMIETAEQDVTGYLSSTERAQLPCPVWTGNLEPILGASQDITLDLDIREFAYARFEGIVQASVGDTVFHAVTTVLAKANSGAGTITPLDSDLSPIDHAEFDVSIDDTGKVLTIDTTDTTATIFITRVLGLQTLATDHQTVSAVRDLVKLAILYKGIVSERVGQYSVSPSDYHDERFKVLGRLVYGGNTSLVA